MARGTTLKDRIVGVIDKLGVYVHLDLKYYLKNFTYMHISQLVANGLALLLSVAFARLMPKEIYGQWNYIFSIIGILAVFSLPGMQTAILQAVARGHDRVLIEGTKEKFKWSILGSLALLGIGAYYFMDGSALLGGSLMISSLVFPFYENLQVFNAFLGGKKQFRRGSRYAIIIQLTSMLSTVLVLYFTRNLIFILITYLVSFSLMRGLFFRLTAKTMENETSDKEALTFGKKMTGVNVFGVISAHGDKIILGILLGFSGLAIYSIARGFQKMIVGSMKPIASLSFPKLAALSEQEAYSAVKKRYRYLVLIAAIAAGVSIVVAPFLIPLLYSQKYADSVLYAQILLAGMIFTIPTSIISGALFPAQRKVKEIYKLEVARVILRTALIVGLIQALGLLGLVLSKLITGVFLMIYSWWQVGWIGPKKPSASPR